MAWWLGRVAGEPEWVWRSSIDLLQPCGYTASSFQAAINLDTVGAT